MEGASIAQVCKLCNIPFVVIRSISDKPNGSNEIDFDKFLELSVKRYQKLIQFLVWVFGDTSKKQQQIRDNYLMYNENRRRNYV